VGHPLGYRHLDHPRPHLRERGDRAGRPARSGGHVAGFPAVQTNDPTADPTHTCELYIDIAEGQTLLVAYVGGPNNPNSATSTHPLACQKAAQAADLMIQTLETRRH